MSNYPTRSFGATTQTETARRALEILQTNLADCADAIGAILAGSPEPWHLQSIGEHMTGDSYGLSFGGFKEVRCPSCGGIDWTCGAGDTAQGLCPKCAQAERTESEESHSQAWHDHLAEQSGTAAYEGDV